MSNLRTDRVLGRVMARDLTEREAENVGGAHGGNICPPGYIFSGYDDDGNRFCDGDGALLP